MQVITYIDTVDSQKTSISLDIDGKRFNYVDHIVNHKFQNLLVLLQTSLNQHKLDISQISQIRVNPGPGSFTGVRVGVTIANVLGWVLGKPVNHRQTALPKYSPSKFDLS